VSKLAWRQYVCRACGLVYDEAKGDADSGLAPGTRFEDIPDDWACPICGVTKADFEPYVPQPLVVAARAAHVATRGQAGVVIVGAGRAGWQMAQALRERDGALPITLVAACSADVYDKPQLSVAVARGVSPQGLVRESAAACALRLNVRLLTNTHAVAIDAERRRLRTTRGSLRWQQLVLAHGAAPVLPPELPPALVWRVNDLAAYQRLRATLDGAARDLVIVGAGLVGCELANDLALAGHHITLLDVQPRPLAALLPPRASERLLEAWSSLPISFIGGVQVAGVLAGPPRQVQLQDGRVLDADQVIAATGLRAPTRLAASAGLAFDMAAGGVAVDSHGATSVPGVFALGDCAAMEGRASRFIEPIARQADAIAAAVLGAPGAGCVSRAPTVRVKTSSLPISVVVHAPGSGAWQVDEDEPDLLRMRRFGPNGDLLASLRAARV
jgi:rubredoxin-NAD+ reductase